MKKLFYSVLILTIFLSCDNKKSKKPETSEKKNIKNLDVTNCTENLTTLEIKIKLENIIVIDVNKLVSKNLFNEFMNSSKEFDFGPSLSTGSNSKMTASRTTLTSTPILAKWLKKYSDYFCFEDSYKFIEELHIVKDTSEISKINASNNPKYRISLRQILDDLAKFDYNKDIIKQLETMNYQSYVSVSISKQNLKILKVDNYFENGNCYSFPFIRSLLYNHKINNTDVDKCFFNFFEFSTNQDLKTIGFSIDCVNKLTPNYFDFSNRPPGGSLNVKYPKGYLPL